MSKIGLLAKDSAIYGVGMALQKVIGFILLPFYTRALSPAEYGVLDSVTTFSFFLTTILSLGIDGSTSRYFFLAETERAKKEVLSTSLWIRMVSYVPIISILLLFSQPISGLLFGTEEYSWVVCISLLIIPLQSFNSLQDIIYRYYRKLWKFVIMTSVRACVMPICGILFVVIVHWGVLGARLGTLLSTLSMLIFSYFFLTREILEKHTFVWELAKKMLKFGFPLIFAGLISWVNSVSDRFFLLHYSTLDEIGLYSIASSFSQPVQLLNTALAMGATVLMMSFFTAENDPDKPETKKFLTNTWHIYLLLSVPIALAISVFGYELIGWVTPPSYLPGILAVPFLLYSHIIVQSTDLTGNGMTLRVQSKPYPIMLSIAAFVNVGLNFYFIPRWGFVGAASTTIISNFVYFAIAYFWSQKVFYIKRSFIKPLLYVFSTFLFAVGVPFLELECSIYISPYFKLLLVILVTLLPLTVRKYRVLIGQEVTKLKNKIVSSK